jgi:hypothetical protein
LSYRVWAMVFSGVVTAGVFFGLMIMPRRMTTCASQLEKTDIKQ